MNPVYEKLQSCLASVREKTDFIPRVALILGSGLGDYAEEIEIREIIPYPGISGFYGAWTQGQVYPWLYKQSTCYHYAGKSPLLRRIFHDRCGASSKADETFGC